MNDAARDQILRRLQAATQGQPVDIPEADDLPVEPLETPQKIDKLQSLMEAVRTEVHVIERSDWITPLKQLLKKRRLKTLLY
ncbi:MAG: hypothetical protein R3274_04820, partial [Desulfobacterales bacterium]|nr:hypothetical protein [Desulfobacterales bacterium]